MPPYSELMDPQRAPFVQLQHVNRDGVCKLDLPYSMRIASSLRFGPGSQVFSVHTMTGLDKGVKQGAILRNFDYLSFGLERLQLSGAYLG